MRCSSALLLTLLLAACTVDDLQYQDRFCDTDYPCPGGYACVNNQCKSGGGGVDLPLAPDGLLDGPLQDGPVHDLPAADVTGPDFFFWDAGPDLMPAPDGGCPSGLTNCGGACVDTQSSFPHCGGCFQSCPTGAADRCEGGTCYCGHQSPVCQNGLTCVQASCTCALGPNSLCDGCCQSGQCMTGTSPSACGTGAVACATCPSSPCTTATCTNGVCGQVNRADGSSCVGVKGVCHGGSCCTGCWNGSACLSGTSTSACGIFGAACKKCLLLLKCVAGNCV